MNNAPSHATPAQTRLPAPAALIALAALLAIAPAALRALDSAPPPEIAAFEIAPLNIDSATLAAITTERYPDADYVVADKAIRTRYAADGTDVTHDDTVIKILTEKGLRENRTQGFTYNVFYETIRVTLARIIKPDGTIIPIDIEKNTKEMTDRSSMSANIYDPNDKQLTLAIPGLQVGDTLQVITGRNGIRSRVKDQFVCWQFFEWAHPIIHATYEVRGPKDKPLLATALLDKRGDTVTSTTRTENDENIYTWEIRDVPQAFPEPSMPAFYICMQRLLLGTVATWEDVSKWYSALCEPHLDPTPEIRAKVAELLSPPPADTATPAPATLTDDEKIRRIFRFVSQEIRYMGIIAEKDAPGFEPHDVALTFNNRYGVCRDKAALLATMLRVAGFDASPVLINVGPHIDKEVPYCRFNHAITAVRHPDGSYTLMDSTNENTVDLLPSYLANKSYLVARPEGDTLRTSPVAPPEENMLRAATRLDIADDGTAIGSTTLDFTGINDNAYRSSFARAKPEDIRRWLESLVKNQIPGATLTAHELTPRNVMDTTRPLRLTFSFTAPDYLAVSQDKTILNTPWFGASFSIASNYLNNGTALAKRRFPLEIPYTCGLDETLAIHLPPRIGETLALPDGMHIEIPAVTFDKTIAREASAITGKLSLRLRAPRIDPGDPYAQLKDALKDIEYANRQSPILAASPKNELQPDIRVLSDDLAITLDDARNWTRRRAIRKQILTYAGKKDNAEMRFNYNPVWETVTLDSATVTLKDGSTRTVSPAELNIMDASWVSAAPRYPAGKTLVVSLPGVEEGGIIDYKVTTTAKNKTWFSIAQTYFDFDPADTYTFTLNTPADITLATNADLAAAKDKTSNTYRVTGSRPVLPREGSLPPPSRVGPVYEAATIDNPADYARLINSAVAPLATPAEPIRKQAAELTAACKTDTDRVIAIRDFVARHIRNAGPNFTDLPLSCLTPAGQTLADRYGNTADRAILLAALLRAAGLQPELLLAARPATPFYWTDKNVFPIDQFDNLIVRVTADGKPCYLDQLSIYADPHTTSLDGCMAIPLATGKTETINLDPVYQTRGDIRCDIDIATNGDATITYTEPHRGANHTYLKRMFKEMTPEEHNRYHQGRMTWISQAATPNGDLVTNLDYPATLAFSARVPRYAVRNGDYLYFQLPTVITSPTPAGPDTRIHPLFASNRLDTTIRWTITLPENTEVEAAPENLDWTGPGDYGQIAIATSISKSETGRAVLTVTETIRLAPAVIPAASYSTLLEINRRLSQPAQWRVLLKTK